MTAGLATLGNVQPTLSRDCRSPTASSASVLAPAFRLWARSLPWEFPSLALRPSESRPWAQAAALVASPSSVLFRSAALRQEVWVLVSTRARARRPLAQRARAASVVLG